MIQQKIHNSEDKLMKYLAKHHGQEFLYYLDSLDKEDNKVQVKLPCKKIKKEIPTEIITPNFKNLLMDFAYEMEDGSITHYEHYSGNLNHGNLIHAGRYAIEKHEETGKPVNTIILSTGNPEKSPREAWIGKVNKFTPIRIIFLKEYDGDKRLKNVKNKIKNNKKLTFLETLDLIFIPFLNTTKNSELIVEEICYLTQNLINPTKKERELLYWGLLLTSAIFIKNPEKLEEIKEVIKMHEKNWQDIIHEYCEELRQEGRNEGIIEGIEKGRNEGIYEAKIKTINEIKTLEKEGKNLTEIIDILTNNTNKSMKK